MKHGKLLAVLLRNSLRKAIYCHLLWKTRAFGRVLVLLLVPSVILIAF